MHSTPARAAHRGRAALIGRLKTLMTVAGIVLSCWGLAMGASVVAAPPAVCQVPAEASQGDARFVSTVKPGSMSIGNDSGQTFNTSSRTDRPRLSFADWKDGAGKPLNANNGDAGTVLPIEIRVGAPGTEGQVKTIYPVFTDGRSDYDMSLWYFTEGMDPHQGRYEIGYRVAGTGDFSTAATLSLNVQLAEPAKDAILTLSDGVLSGSGWAFDGNRSITGGYKVRLRLLDAGGGQTDVVVPVEFTDGVFSLDASELTGLGPSGGVYGIRALSAEGDVIDSASVGFSPSATLTSGDAYSAGDELTLSYSGWATLDGEQITEPVYTVNVINPSSGAVVGSYSLSTSTPIPGGGSAQITLSARTIVDAARTATPSVSVTGTYSLTISGPPDLSETTPSFTIDAGSSASPAPRPSASPAPARPPVVPTPDPGRSCAAPASWTIVGGTDTAVRVEASQRIRVAGGGWCEGQKALNGMYATTLSVLDAGGQVVAERDGVSLTFTDGAFQAQLSLTDQLQSLPAGQYTLRLGLRGSTASTGAFVLGDWDGATAAPSAASTGPAGPAPTAGAGSADRPTAEPTPGPTDQPTPAPTDQPSVEPTPGPTDQPTAEPTDQPTAEPTDQPTPEPTPTATPEATPTPEPTPTPTAEPTPTTEPTPEESPSATPDPRTEKPQAAPSAPVADPGQLNDSNAGSLSGTREGSVLTLRMPSAKVKEGDWVSVYFFPPASTQGWVQVDADHSVTIDISGLDAGTYQVAVAGRDNELLGWAQLDLQESLASAKGGVMVDTKTSSPSNLGSADWMLVAAGGLLMLGAASFVVLMRPGSAQRR